MSCLQCFSTEDILDNHRERCIEVNGKQAVEMPDEDNNILKFNNYNRQMYLPFVIYADFEALLPKVDTCKKDITGRYTEEHQKHKDCGYGYKLVCCYDDKYSKDIQVYRGENAVYKFMEKMLEEVEYCKNVMSNEFNKPLVMTEDEEKEFQDSTKCWICDKKYKKKDIKVRDHCHVTGKYRGSAHQHCNLKLRIEIENFKIPVIFHNLRGYDSHFIMQEIGKFKKNINVIPNNMERYMAFMLGKHLSFIDSFQFMASSLDSLVKNLPDDKYKYTSGEFQGGNLKLMQKKGVYLYDYMDSFERFNEEVLSAKDAFYSDLNDQHISWDDYEHAMKVWFSFDLKTLGEYHDLYLKSDVLLLADVFENFRSTCMQYYKLDPCHYFTSPGLSWDAMLKMTNIKLELITDIDMYLFVEKGLRGGTSYIAHRHSEANNKYMKNYNQQ